jgi:copper chaperone CopZ
METKVFEVPAMYADHHVTEVRKILLELEGVVNVYASSAFQVVEVMYDETKINDLEIAVKLDDAGYLGEWSLPIETNAAQQTTEGQNPYFRHSITYETTKQTVSFGQTVPPYQGGPARHCPGIGAVRMDEEENNG